MNVETINKIRKLAPEQRLEEIKGLKIMAKRENEETELLIKESMEEIERERISRDIPAPKEKPVDITRLFEPEGEGVAAHLDDVQKDKPSKQDAAIQYVINAEEAVNIYHELGNLAETNTSLWGREEREKFYHIEARLSKVRDNYISNDEIADTVMIDRRIAKQLRGYLR